MFMRVALLLSTTTFLVWARSPVFNAEEIVNSVVAGVALLLDLVFTIIATKVIY
jgi:hypothetical protein